MSDPKPQPTRVRYSVVAVCMLMSWLLYLDRFCVGMAEPYIKQDLNLSTFQVGLFLSAFFLTYALFQVPSGWMSDKFGSRIMLTIYILAWSFFTAMMGLSYGFVMLLCMRAAYGLGQAGAYPTSASILSKWVPFNQRGFASGLVAFGGRVGGAVAPVLTAVLIVSFVPTSSSSTIEKQHLLDPVGLAFRIFPQSSDEAPSVPANIAHIQSQLSESQRTLITNIANRNTEPINERRQLEAQVKELQKSWRLLDAARVSKKAEQIDFFISSDETDQLTAIFNDWITSSDFYDAKVFSQMGRLDRAALKYMKQVDSGGSLSDDERQRFHRLLLEGTFSSELAKVYVAGWRPVIILYGAAGLLVAGLFFYVVRKTPDVHPRCNDAEVQLIQSGPVTSQKGPLGKLPWGPLLRSRSMWLNCLSQVGTNIGWVFLVTWFPRYLLEQHQVPIIQRGVMASTPLFLGWLGMIGGGRLTDWLVPRVGVKWARRLPWSVTRFVGMFAFIACPMLDDPWMVTLALSVVAISTDMGTSATWAFCQDVGGKHVGSVLGWGNMWGNLGATISPILLAWIFENYNWTLMFFVCACAFLFSGLCSLGVDATVPIANKDEE